MNTPSSILARITVFVAMTTSVLVAQEADEIPIRYFQSPRLALLFHIGGLNLNKYEGGVGFGLRQSDKLYWRFSVGFAANYSSDARSNVQGTTSNSSRTEYAPSVFLAPIVVCYQQDPAFVFLSPCLGGSYLRRVSEMASTDTLGIHTRREVSEGGSISAGCSLGGGGTVSQRLLISGEYRVFLRYQKDHYSYASAGYEASELSLSNYLSDHSWSIGSAAILTLYYQL